MLRIAARTVLVAVLCVSAAAAGAAAPTTSPRVLGAVWDGRGRLAWLDPVTLEPTRVSPLRFGAGYTTVLSPDHRTIALQAGRSPAIRFLTADTLRLVRTVRSPRVWLGDSLWQRPDRLITLPGWLERGAVRVLNPITGKLVASHPVSGTPIRVVSTQRLLAFLAVTPDRIAPATLVVVRGEGTVRSVVLHDVEAGFDDATEAQPGLAVDPGGRRVAVVTPTVVAIVDLRTMSVRTHRLALRRPARVQKLSKGWVRHAVWAAPTRLAITGDDHGPVDSGGRAGIRYTPAGLTLVDTTSWRTQAIDPGVSQVVRDGRLLLATAVDCDAAGGCTGVGLRAYSFTGRLRYQLFGNESLTTPLVLRGRGYFSGCNSFCYRIVDVRRGAVVATARTKLQTILLG
jgi:hypothetical protein